ncbi:hypothetical protein OESDEN_01970 [Oesophagostomum dentatum]|uniref:Uncharacterized protein n=1 Tax=Oesophagostomum dentatum TaxID=61180 RepID=A0A0B1TQG4_OESDE|nr:hypothetical protein OESDEN_01970 [Oesophagostomum dentatum]
MVVKETITALVAPHQLTCSISYGYARFSRACVQQLKGTVRLCQKLFVHGSASGLVTPAAVLASLPLLF